MTRITSLVVVVFAALAVVMTACSDPAVIEAAPVSGETGLVSAATTVVPTAPAPAVVLAAAPRESEPASAALPSATTTQQPTTTSLPAPETTTTTSAPPPPPEPYVVGEGEVRAGAKRLAAEIAQRITTYDAGTSRAAIAAAIAPAGEPRMLLETAIGPLFHTDHWSRGTVVYPQLGGSSDTGVSVMVVVRQDLGTGGATVESQTRTLDIRLALIDGAWEFAELASAGGTPVARPSNLSPEAIAVLDDPRILLPDSARWDIHRGHTSPELLRLMSDLADVTPYAVTVLATGHPHNVFETDRTSKHTVGRAVDVYMVGTDLVIDDRTEGSLTHRTLQWLYDVEGIYKLGGPWALDERGGRSFTDIVHQDHLHISVS